MPPSEPQRRGAHDRRSELISCLALLVGIVAAGLVAQAVGVDTKSFPIAVLVAGVGVFVGVGLGKALLRR